MGFRVFASTKRIATIEGRRRSLIIIIMMSSSRTTMEVWYKLDGELDVVAVDDLAKVAHLRNAIKKNGATMLLVLLLGSRCSLRA